MRGISLIELLVVIALLAIISVGISLNYISTQREVELEASAQDIISALLYAQGMAIAGKEGERWGIHFENPFGGESFYALFKGDSYVDPGEEKFFLSRLVDFLNPSDGSSIDVIFNRFGKTTNSYSIEIVIKNKTSPIKIININQEGKIE